MLPILGAQFEGALGNRDRWVVPNRTYFFSLRWDEIELTPNIYTFPQWAYDTITRLDMKLGVGNYQLIIGVKTTPKFYAVYPDHRNSPPKPENYINFSKFIQVLCDTFHPFGVEIWNEPEFTMDEAGSNDEYYGGFGLDGADEYGRMTATVYNYISRRRARTRIIAGASFGFVDVDRSLEFLRIAKKAGMRSHYWSWHGYINYYDVLAGTKAFYSLLWFANETYKIYPKPQIVSEISVLRDTDADEEPKHREKQAELLQFMLKYKNTTKIESMLWYTLANNGWEHSDMIMNNIEYPVYDVWRI